MPTCGFRDGPRPFSLPRPPGFGIALSPERGRLAQLVERLVYTENVGGSSPSSPTILFLDHAALLVPAWAGNTNFGEFLPLVAVDRASILVVRTPGQSEFAVSKVGTLTFNAANAANAIIRNEITFTTKVAARAVPCNAMLIPTKSPSFGATSRSRAHYSISSCPTSPNVCRI